MTLSNLKVLLLANGVEKQLIRLSFGRFWSDTSGYNIGEFHGAIGKDYTISLKAGNSINTLNRSRPSISVVINYTLLKYTNVLAIVFAVLSLSRRDGPIPRGCRSI